MKGLLIKDLCLLRNQKKLAFIFPILGIWFAAMGNSAFGFPFMAMMASIVTLSTLSYDEADRSQTHLFTLPFDRKTYVLEKFLLGLLLLAASLALMCVCAAVRFLLVSPGAQDADGGLTLFFSVCAGIILLSVMIPIRIRFGSDQGRLILYAVFAIAALGCAALSKLLPNQADLAARLIEAGGVKTAVFSAAGLTAVLAPLGCLLGFRWIARKEF